MTLVIILAGIISSYIAVYGLISEVIKDHKYEIMNKLKRIEKQINLLREDVNDLRLQLDDMWKKTQKIVNRNETEKTR